jgi:hypothetical protein
MQKYYNDFFVITAPPNLLPGAIVNFDIKEVDCFGYNSVIIVNLGGGFLRVPAVGGILIQDGQRLEIKGNKNETLEDKITINTFRSSATRNVLIIRKKYIQ